MFLSGQRMMENFLKRSRLRRSRKLRNSFRTSFIGRSSSGPNQSASSAPQVVEPETVNEHELERLQANRKSRKWRQSFIRRSQKGKPQDEVGASEAEMLAGTQMPIISSSSNKLRPRTAHVRRLECDAMDTNNTIELLSFKMEDKERISTDSKMVELLKTEVTNLRKELLKQKETVVGLQEKEKLLQDRLSEQARRQLEKGSTKFEDLNLGPNRPTQLIERYGNLYSEGRVDALDALDELPEIGECEDLKTKLLLSIVVLSFRSAQKTLLDIRARMRDLLHIPRVLQTGQSFLCHAARDLEDEVGVYLRKTVEKHDLLKNHNDVSERVWSTLFEYPSLRECKGLKRYIRECVSTAWALTIQNPPLVIDYSSGEFDEDKHSRFHTSDSNSNAIKTFLWPALTEGDKGVCVNKGIVIT